MLLIKAGTVDFEKIKNAYIDIAENTPDIDKYARYEYGKHPNDEEITEYIADGNMYMLMDHDTVAGVIAMTTFQGEEYHPIKWKIRTLDDEVMVLHLLGIVPSYQGKGVGKIMIRKALELAREKSLKVCRLDTLASNIPAQRFYEKLGFTYCGKQHWYAENTGWTDFYLYEYVLEDPAKDIRIQDIDSGKGFDWGKTSEDYAKYRDIYPQEFYQYVLELGLCKDGQKCLDVGTGTGVFPRNMYKYGAHWTGTDISENQIKQAQILANAVGMDISFYTCDAKDLDLEAGSLDVITACQCIWYLDHKVTAPKFSKVLKTFGSFLILYMGWLPFEDEIAGNSEDLILKYNPEWSGHGDTVHPVLVPEDYLEYFTLEKREEFRVDIPFTREGWHGRMRACRGTSASMSRVEFELWEKEHMKMLEDYPEKFNVKHYVSIAWLKKKGE